MIMLSLTSRKNLHQIAEDAISMHRKKKKKCLLFLIHSYHFFLVLISFILLGKYWIHSVSASEIFCNYCICHKG